MKKDSVNGCVDGFALDRLGEKLGYPDRIGQRVVS